MAFKQMINKDLMDEVHAKIGYRKLAKGLRRKGLKKQARSITAISRDEADHFKILRKIKKAI
jgi:rubrerythrin